VVSTAWISFAICLSVRQYASAPSSHPFAGSGSLSAYEPPNVDWYSIGPEPSEYWVAAE